MPRGYALVSLFLLVVHTVSLRLSSYVSGPSHMLYARTSTNNRHIKTIKPGIIYFKEEDDGLILWQCDNGAELCNTMRIRRGANEDSAAAISLAMEHTSHLEREGEGVGQAAALLGFFNVSRTEYVALVTRTEPTEAFIDPSIRRISEVKLLKIPGSPISLNETEIHDEQLSLLEAEFRRHTLYFSSDRSTDVTRTVQGNQLRRQQGDNISTWWKGCDERFFWNLNLLRPLLDNPSPSPGVLDVWVTPITNAWADCTYFSLDGRPYSLSLVSRRSRLRQGARMMMRGVDAAGNVANHVETEQVLRSVDGRDTFSFLQIRGSVPVYWTQSEVWIPSPPILVDESLRHSVALTAHLDDLHRQYSHAVFVNLVDKVGSQGELGRCLVGALNEIANNRGDRSDLYRSMLDRDAVTITDHMIPPNNATEPLRVRHVWFDFHHKVNTFTGSDRTWEAVLEHLEDDTIGKEGFYSHREGIEETLQQTVVRTNCVDCLDRTNVVQAAIGRAVLMYQLHLMGHNISRTTNTSLAAIAKRDLPKAVERTVRKLWVDNGDGISDLYAGTRSLKRDLTRNGKRTSVGIVKDALSSFVRYVLGNFVDRGRQRGIDMLVGVKASANTSDDQTRRSVTATSDNTPIDITHKRDEGVEENDSDLIVRSMKFPIRNSKRISADVFVDDLAHRLRRLEQRRQNIMYSQIDSIRPRTARALFQPIEFEGVISRRHMIMKELLSDLLSTIEDSLNRPQSVVSLDNPVVKGEEISKASILDAVNRTLVYSSMDHLAPASILAAFYILFR